MSALLGGIIGGAGSIIGGLLGNSAQKKANAANVQMAQDANQMNWDMWHGSNDINRRYFDDANAFTAEQTQNALNFAREEARNAEAYNDPSAQRARLEAAGINPLGMVSAGGGIAASGSAGQSATGSAAGYASPIAGRVDPVNSMSSAVANASQLFGEGVTAEMAERSDNTKLRQANADLVKKLGEKTLRPKVGGVFGGGDIPAVGFGNAQISQPSVAALLNGETDELAPENSIRPPFIDRDDPDYPSGKSMITEDERPPVRVFNPFASKWTYLPAQTAEQLKLTNGSHLFAEHLEALTAEVGSNAYGVAAAADMLLGNAHPDMLGDTKEHTQRSDKLGTRHFPQSRPASPPKRGSDAHNSILEHERKRRQRGF